MRMHGGPILSAQTTKHSSVENTASNHMMSLGLIVEPVQPVRGMDNGR